MLNAVTGAFGYIGKYITAHLLSRGEEVRNLTGHPRRDSPFGTRVSVHPLDFNDSDGLVPSLQGVRTLYNTYWVRFPRGDITFERAVANSTALIQAARRAGVRRIVHISITNPSEDSTLPYFRGKALVEKAIVASGLSYAIIRPTVVFGAEDILINNIAWLLRRFPIFPIFGSGGYGIQPVYVEDLAEIAVNAGHDSGNVVVDAVGPETYTFEDMVRLIARSVRGRSRLVHVSPGFGLALSRVVGLAVGDVVITRDEVEGLMAGLLVSSALPTGHTLFGQWLHQNVGGVGVRYASELKRHYM